MNLESWQIMFFLYIFSALTNYYRLTLEDNNDSPGLQKLFFILSIISGFLSLPVTLIAFGITYMYSKRMSKLCDRDINKAKVEVIDSKNYEIQVLKERIAHYDELIDSDRKRCHQEGYQSAVREFRKHLEREHLCGYEEGYRDGQRDYPEGINILEE